MSRISGSGGASGADRADAFDDRLIGLPTFGGLGATLNGSPGDVKITKREMEQALPTLTRGGPLDAKSRMDVWKKMSRLALTDGARTSLEKAIGKPAAPATPATPSGRLAQSLAKLAKGLLYTSESDYPYKAFHRPMNRATPLDEASFKALMGLPRGHTVRIDGARDVDDFFRQQQDPSYVSDPAERAKYAAIEKAMKRDLTDLKLIYGASDDVVEAPVYLIGRARDGSLVGLESTRIWT